jgi:hypothetical protein
MGLTIGSVEFSENWVLVDRDGRYNKMNDATSFVPRDTSL